MNSSNQTLGVRALSMLLVLAAPCAMAQTSSSDATTAPASTVAPDNSRSNKLDSSNVSASADAQKQDATDVRLTQRIRRSIVADKRLSTYGHNVKIVSVNGTVTLNGVVHSDTERSIIEAKAKNIAGDGHIVDDIKVASK